MLEAKKRFDNDFCETFEANVTTDNKVKSFWPDKNNRSAFVRRYNLKYGKNTKTFFNKRDLLVQLRPALIMSYAW